MQIRIAWKEEETEALDGDYMDLWITWIKKKKQHTDNI
jgi:hypothetical protein